jgi:polyhydroxyalkanoate synthesis regulator phasin
MGMRVRQGIEQAGVRLTSLEEEAQKMILDLVRRTKASRREVTQLFERLSAQDLLEREAVKEWSGKARHAGTDAVRRLEELRDRAVAYVGIASREQVDELARDFTRLSRKLDKFLGSRRTPRG